MDIFNTFKQKVTAEQLIVPNSRLILGVSGGVDSMVLLDLMHRLRYVLGLHLYVVHINHHWRKESGRDQALVEFASQKLGIESRVYHSSSTSKKTEDNARKDRYKFFTQAAKKLKTNSIVLAHHRDDVAETVLMRLLRGTGLHGLRGILEQKSIADLHIIRPLLTHPKKQLLIHAKHIKIQFILDKSNVDTKYFRNKLRHDVIPYLEKINPDINSTLQNLAEQSNVDYTYLDTQASNYLQRHAITKNSKGKKVLLLADEKLTKAPIAIQRLLIKKSLILTKKNDEQITWESITNFQNSMTRKRPFSLIFPFSKGSQ